MRILRKIAIIGFILFLVLGGYGTYKIYNANHNIWLKDYLFNSPFRSETDKLTDIIFVVVDHWEPSGNINILKSWMSGYRIIADKHLDSDGNKLQHDWYYPIEQFRSFEIDSLVQLCKEGYGDIGIQLHHENDTPESLKEKLSIGIDSLQKYGALNSIDNNNYFSFVHGNWALDNSIYSEEYGNACGVNNELDILKRNL